MSEATPLSTNAILTMAYLISGDEALQAQVLILKFLPMLQTVKNQVISTDVPYNSPDKVLEDEQLLEVRLNSLTFIHRGAKCALHVLVYSPSSSFSIRYIRAASTRFVFAPRSIPIHPHVAYLSRPTSSTSCGQSSTTSFSLDKRVANEPDGSSCQGKKFLKATG
jgi:hypothetical protein